MTDPTIITSLEDFYEKYGYMDPRDQLAYLEELENEIAIGGAKLMRSLWDECDEVREDEQRRIDALTSLARAETRLIWIGDHLLRAARRIRHPFTARA